MSNFIYNIAKGKIAEKVADGATLRLLLLKAADADATLRDIDNIQALLALAGTTEADFTNYARANLANVVVNVDDSSDSVKVDCDDVQFASAGGALNNNVVDAVIYEFDTDDANSTPLLHFDAVFTTDGNNVNLQVNANGLFEST